MAITTLCLFFIYLAARDVTGASFTPCNCNDTNKIYCIAPTNLYSDIHYSGVAVKCSGMVETVDIECLGRTTLADIKTGFLRSASSTKEIRINNCNFTGLFPGCFSGLPRLKNIFISGSNLVDLPAQLFDHISQTLTDFVLQGSLLERIPANIFRQTQLKTIYLWNNKITSIDAQSFQGISTLDKIHLNNNQITRIDAQSFQGISTLDTIHLNNNHISSIDNNAFNGNNQLKNVYLQNNKLSELDFSLVTGLPNITVVNAINNDISDLKMTTRSAAPLPLQQLYLSKNEITTIPDGLFQSFPEIVTIDMAENKIKNLPVGFLKGYKKLRVVYFSNNMIEVLPDELFRDCPELRSVSFDYNQIHSVMPTVFPLSLTVQTSRYQFYFGMKGNNLSNPSALFESVKNRDFNIAISIEDNGISEFPNISSSIDFSLLYLSGNDLTDIPADAFKDVKINKLEISNNHGVLHIHKNAFNEALTGTLDLSGSTLHDLEFLGNYHGNIIGLSGTKTTMPFQLPSSGLQKVISIGASNSGFKSIPTRLPNLKTLSIGENLDAKITTFPPKVVTLTIQNKLPIEIEDSAMDGSNVEYLYLTGNSFIKTPNFSLAKQLDTLDISSCDGIDINNIKVGDIIRYLYLKGLDLKNVPAVIRGAIWLQTADLSENSITVIKKQDFIKNSLIMILHLQKNKITHIEDCAFSYFDSLVLLDLSENLLSTISANIGLRSIAAFNSYVRPTINLRNNSITTLKQEDFSILFSYGMEAYGNQIIGDKLYLRDNPIECGCETMWLFQRNVKLFQIGADLVRRLNDATCTLNGNSMYVRNILPTDLNCNASDVDPGFIFNSNITCPEAWKPVKPTTTTALPSVNKSSTIVPSIVILLFISMMCLLQKSVVL